MRLDLFLKTSRLIVRRSFAQEFCDAGMVKVNGKQLSLLKKFIRATKLRSTAPTAKQKVRVLKIPEKKQVSRNEAVELYEVLAENIIRDDILDY